MVVAVLVGLLVATGAYAGIVQEGVGSEAGHHSAKTGEGGLQCCPLRGAGVHRAVGGESQGTGLADDGGAGSVTHQRADTRPC